MSNKGTLYARIVNTHDVESNWDKAVSFIPRSGEIIVYDPDTTNTTSRIKIGDGIHAISELPFLVEASITDYFAESNGIIYLNGGNIRSYENQ